MIWALICFAIPGKLEELSLSETTTSKSFKIYILCYRSAMLCGVLFYFWAAVWKLGLGILDGNIFRLDYASNIIAFYLLSHGKISLFGDFLVQNQLAAYIGMFVFLIIHLSSPLIFFNRRYLKIWPFLILLFHFASILSVQVNFLISGMTISFLCFFAPESAATPLNLKAISSFRIFKSQN